jgi:hypothetical protein
LFGHEDGTLVSVWPSVKPTVILHLAWKARIDHNKNTRHVLLLTATNVQVVLESEVIMVNVLIALCRNSNKGCSTHFELSSKQLYRKEWGKTPIPGKSAHA